MAKKRDKFERLPAFNAPIAEDFRQLVREEREAVERGDTLGLDPYKQYLGLRVLRPSNAPAVWVVAESPVDTAQVSGTILFVASLTIGTAMSMVRFGAEVIANE